MLQVCFAACGSVVLHKKKKKKKKDGDFLTTFN